MSVRERPWRVNLHQASLYNAFKQKYADPGGAGLAEDSIVQDGRNFRIKVGYNFQ